MLICNKANSPKCPLPGECEHSEPHEEVIDFHRISSCKESTECFDVKGKPIFKVKCIKFKGK